MKKSILFIELFVSTILIINLVYAGMDLESGSVPGIFIKDGTSTNWAGYSVLTNLDSPINGSVSEVNGTWTVPFVECSLKETSYGAFWIGIDGHSSPTVEQIGTDSDCFRGKAKYYAWYEMYPRSPTNIRLKISPGDKIFADVKYIGNNKFILTIKDLSTNESYKTTQRLIGAKRSSAEWIAEAPSSRRYVLPLVDFNKIVFSDLHVTVNGVNGGIKNENWEYENIDLKSSNGIEKARTSNLNSVGDGFLVTWLNY
jgi:hypothetical protein